MKRETFEFDPEIIDGGIDAWLPKEFELIEENIIGNDSEKGFSFYDIIIQRKSDKKFFRAEKANYGQGNVDYEEEWTEVFPKHINKIIYE